MGDDSDHILSALSDSALDLPALEFEEDDVNLDEDSVPASVKKRDILIEVDGCFRKVITLNNEQDLKSLFRSALFNDPDYRHYSYVPFKLQIFSEKFCTWVDFDYSDVPHLNDGTCLKAVFRAEDKSKRRSKHKHKRKSKRKDSSSHKHKKKKSSKRRRVSSDEEYKASNFKRSRNSYSLDESRSLVTKRVLDEPNNTPYRTHNRQCNVPNNCCSMQYNLCSVSSATFTVSASNYMALSSRFDKSKVYKAQEKIEEGETNDEGEIYTLSLALRGKNPVSALHELCTKLQYETPTFEVIEAQYVPEPQFLMEVTVEGKSYIPDEYARRKKEAKKLAAEHCLKKMGYL